MMQGGISSIFIGVNLYKNYKECTEKGIMHKTKGILIRKINNLALFPKTVLTSDVICHILKSINLTAQGKGELQGRHI